MIELLRWLKLPVFDVHVALETFNQQRKAELDRKKKTDGCKRRRIERKVERTLDSHACMQCRKRSTVMMLIYGNSAWCMSATMRVLIEAKQSKVT